MATLNQLTHTLDALGEPYHVLRLHEPMSALLSRRGARVLGLFPTPDAPNLLWTNPALDTPDGFRRFIAAGEWNMGGERCWIAPEIQYNTSDRSRFFDTLLFPPAMDPGGYTLAAEGGAVTFHQTLALAAYNIASGSKKLDVRRVIRPVDNPLRALPAQRDLLAGVQYAGYEQTVTLTELDKAPILSEIWNLAQLNPGGQLIIPCLAPVEASDYFGSVPDEARAVRDGRLRLHITGQRQYKIGYKAACMTGRLAYWKRLDDGREYLLVRHFFNNPSAIYAEEPPDQPGVTGHSVHVYNDGGQFGGGSGFGELECTGQTIGPAAGRSSSTDSFILWIYIGAAEPIRRIAALLLGVTL